jgi:hypothetical protein
MTDKQLTDRYQKDGNERFYRYLLGSAVERLVRIQAGLDATSPEIELLEQAEHFLRLYRKEGVDCYLDISRLLRKAGHKVYRLMLKKNLTPKNARFLQVV